MLEVVSHSLRKSLSLKSLLGVLHQEYSTGSTAPLDSKFVFVMGSLARMVSNCSMVGYLCSKDQLLQLFTVYIAMAHPLQW